MDDIDRQILRELRNDGRISQQDLARRLHLARPTASRHLTRLIDREGVKVVGVVHPAVQGITAMGHVSVDTDGEQDRVAADLAEIPDIVFVSVTAGLMSLVVEIRAKTGADFQRALDAIRAHPSVIGSTTVIYGEIIQDVLQPVRPAEVSLDDVDRRLIEGLRRDGRASYATLAAHAGISAATSRARVLRLLDEDVVRIGVIQERPSQDNLLRFGAGLRTRGVAKSMGALLDMPELHFIVATVGRFDVVATIDGVTREQAKNVFSRLHGLPEVLSVESWLHLSVIKEQY